MGFSDELRKTCSDMWDREKVHPFVTGIGDGTLEIEKFRYYMRQDYLFLIDFCKAISLAAAKTSDVEDMSWFANLLHETLNTEMSLHVSFCQDFGISEAELISTEPSPTTLAYTRHLLQTGYTAGIGEIAASILPCSWGYAEIGQMLASNGAPDNQPLYGRWIETYSTPEFAGLAEWLRSFIDRVAEGCSSSELRSIEQVFVASSQYEYMFWDAAYRMEQWPV